MYCPIDNPIDMPRSGFSTCTIRFRSWCWCCYLLLALLPSPDWSIFFKAQVVGPTSSLLLSFPHLSYLSRTLVRSLSSHVEELCNSMSRAAAKRSDCESCLPAFAAGKSSLVWLFSLREPGKPQGLGEEGNTSPPKTLEHREAAVAAKTR